MLLIVLIHKNVLLMGDGDEKTPSKNLLGQEFQDVLWGGGSLPRQVGIKQLTHLWGEVGVRDQVVFSLVSLFPLPFVFACVSSCVPSLLTSWVLQGHPSVPLEGRMKIFNYTNVFTNLILPSLN